MNHKDLDRDRLKDEGRLGKTDKIRYSQGPIIGAIGGRGKGEALMAVLEVKLE